MGAEFWLQYGRCELDVILDNDQSRDGGVFTQLAGLSFPQEYTSDLTPELSVASQISLERGKPSPKG